MNRAIVGRGAAYGDFDNDGDLDLLITANNGPARLLRNDNANQNDLLRVKTVGARANRDGIGAKVIVKTCKGSTLFGMVRTGSSYFSQSELPLTFGLGKPEEGKTVSLEIVWPSGQKDFVAKVKPNQFITLQEERASSPPGRSFLRRLRFSLLVDARSICRPVPEPCRINNCHPDRSEAKRAQWRDRLFQSSRAKGAQWRACCSSHPDLRRLHLDIPFFL